MNVAGQDFKDISLLSGVNSVADGRSFAYWDFDRDGWQDILIVNANRPALEIYQNQIAKKFPNRKSVGFRLVGGNRSAKPSKQWSNRDAYGAKITIECGGKTIVRELKCGEGFAAQNSKTLLIGLGESEVIESVKIAWPSGKLQQLSGVQPGEVVTIYENSQESELQLTAESADGQQLAWSSEPLQATRPMEPAEEAFSKISFQLSGNSSDQQHRQNAKYCAYMAMATSCGICTKSLPQIAELKTALGDQVQFFGLPIDVADNKEKLDKYVQRNAPEYRMVSELDHNGKTAIAKIMATSLGSVATPAFLVTDKGGKLIAATAGVPPVSWLAEKIQRNQRKNDSPQPK